VFSREQSDELGDVIGASTGSRQRLTLYIPTEDREGEPIDDREVWFQEAIEILTRIGGGATVMPCRGAWYNTASGEIIQEYVDVIYTFVKADGLTQNLSSFRSYLHRLGRETNQGEVAFEFDGTFFRIDEFDE
jgi:hypothetical protein